ncbi:hypothetical protein [Paenibacillus tepidiphilus]|uniref:hypothetical protein n=1 Tax=Paenibacillus tepidiphilus TaxID=2608683 RepID=UPI00123854EF|nr:hypothetical protein [Paenibacillus tepidiphilus]
MNWYTTGQMLHAIRIGQKASTPDGRTVLRTARGLFWSGGRADGTVVELKDYLFTEIWNLYEDAESLEAGAGREAQERREREMLENQYEEVRRLGSISGKANAEQEGQL